MTLAGTPQLVLAALKRVATAFDLRLSKRKSGPRAPTMILSRRFSAAC
jgi:hypothetical protein